MAVRQSKLEYELPCAVRQRGFTLYELIAVIVVAGILAVSAFAIFDKSEFDAQGFGDYVLAALSQGQKLAIAQRRPVRVTIASGQVTLEYCQAQNCSGPWVAFPTGVRPDGGAIAAPTGVVLASSVSPFQFTPLGGTNAANVQITITTTSTGATRTLVVEAGTGYVHP